jgi:GMC oxidoreductase
VIAAYRELLAAKELPVRIYAMLWGADESLFAAGRRLGVASDPSAVVDKDFKVIGTQGLGIVDASVFPILGSPASSS